MDLSKEQNNIVVKRDRSVLKNVKYHEALMANPSAKLGDVDGAILVHVSRDAYAKSGVNILMAALSNAQALARFEINSSTKANDSFVNYMARGLSVGCQDEVH